MTGPVTFKINIDADAAIETVKFFPDTKKVMVDDKLVNTTALEGGAVSLTVFGTTIMKNVTFAADGSSATLSAQVPVTPRVCKGAQGDDSIYQPIGTPQTYYPTK